MTATTLPAKIRWIATGHLYDGAPCQICLRDRMLYQALRLRAVHPDGSPAGPQPGAPAGEITVGLGCAVALTGRTHADLHSEAVAADRRTRDEALSVHAAWAQTRLAWFEEFAEAHLGRDPSRGQAALWRRSPEVADRVARYDAEHPEPPLPLHRA